MKVLDATSPLLFNYISSGTIISKVYILYDKPAGTNAAVQQDYFRIFLADAMITSLQLSGSNDNPSESVSFAFQSVEIAYKAEQDDGTLAAAVPKGYDLETLAANWAAPDKF
jgi:type VI secretion system secreted protein Hcp